MQKKLSVALLLLVLLFTYGCANSAQVEQTEWTDEEPELQAGWGVLTEEEYYKRYGVGYGKPKE